MEEDILLARVCRWGGLRAGQAERAVTATLRALRDGLFDEEADMLAQELPPRLARIFLAGTRDPAFADKTFYEHVAAYERVSMSFGVEHAQAVCEALASLLPPPLVSGLSSGVPWLAALFALRDRDSHPATILSPHARTVAEGHPGSDRPLSEAHPSEGNDTSAERGRGGQ